MTTPTHTPEETMEMRRRLAELCFTLQDRNGHTWLADKDGDYYCTLEEWRPDSHLSIGWAQAGMVVEAMRVRWRRETPDGTPYWQYEWRFCSSNGKWGAFIADTDVFIEVSGDDIEYEEWADTLPAAICWAAHACLRAENGE